MNAGLKWTLIGAFAVAVAAVIALDRRDVANLRAKLDASRDKRRELIALTGENRRLLAAKATAEEVAGLTKTGSEIARLRSEVETLSIALRESQRTNAADVPKPAAVVLAASEWKNAGQATPRATVETALWAAAGGEVDLLAKTLVLDEAARTAAKRFLDGLPQVRQEEYSTPERLIALLAAKELLAGAAEARLAADAPDDTDGERVRVRLRDAGGVTQTANLVLRRESDGWRMVVSERAVAKYLAALSGGVASRVSR